jgi:hypothetical protein
MIELNRFTHLTGQGEEREKRRQEPFDFAIRQVHGPEQRRWTQGRERVERAEFRIMNREQ